MIDLLWNKTFKNLYQITPSAGHSLDIRLARMLRMSNEYALSLGGLMFSICARFKRGREKPDASGRMRL
jgi:hypothetical protein